MRKLLAYFGLLLLASLIFAPAANAAGQGTAQNIPMSTLPNGTNIVGQVKDVKLGSTNATLTLTNGQSVKVDFGELAGASGGTNYIGWAMTLFGMSVASRLIASFGRLLRPVRGLTSMRRG